MSSQTKSGSRVSPTKSGNNISLVKSRNEASLVFKNSTSPAKFGNRASLAKFKNRASLAKLERVRWQRCSQDNDYRTTKMNEWALSNSMSPAESESEPSSAKPKELDGDKVSRR
ncbi:hypothetical protein SLEP1_g25492 [Rubroshorea leprosula]|uniref:Uncharacterized protein n=1 Tax=Rubroshorea leprosula TaxID=152421 RepID=A0AAV5JQ98_9ROSI|nr:hypothetical protein SLEP1_g25492 [Rubroshorea leprosula]